METATIQWTGEQKFLATSPSGHAVPFDSDRESNKAPGPMEMVLMALGACTATDIPSRTWELVTGARRADRADVGHLPLGRDVVGEPVHPAA